jgi:hypothetical protein
MNYITYAITLAALLLGCLAASAVHAESNDTYNFYFQKAPGPKTVNQGTPANVTETPTSPAPLAPAPSNVASLPVSEPSGDLQRSVEISLGTSGSRPGGPQTVGSAELANGLVNTAQYYGAVQVNVNELFAIEANAYRLVSAPTDGYGWPTNDTLWDFGGALVVTPLRLHAGRDSKVTFSALAGMMTVPFYRGQIDYHFTPGLDEPGVGHAGSLFYGARASVELKNRFAIQTSVRRIDRYAATQGSIALSLLL